MLSFLRAPQVDTRPTGLYVGWLGDDAWELGDGWEPGDIGYVGVGVHPPDRWADHDGKLWGSYIGEWQVCEWIADRADAERVERIWIGDANGGRGTPFNLAHNVPGAAHGLAFEESERRQLEDRRGPVRKRRVHGRRARARRRRRRSAASLVWRVSCWSVADRSRRRALAVLLGLLVGAVLWLDDVAAVLTPSVEIIRSVEEPAVPEVELPDLGVLREATGG